MMSEREEPSILFVLFSESAGESDLDPLHPNARDGYSVDGLLQSLKINFRLISLFSKIF